VRDAGQSFEKVQRAKRRAKLFACPFRSAFW
jgi:hypothetical protein